MRALVGACALGLALACATRSSAGKSEGSWCPGSPVEFGTVPIGGLGFHVVDATGRGVPARVRIRRDAYLLHPGDWEESPTTDDGIFGTADYPDGRYEVEICGSNARPIHGFIDVVPGSPAAVTFRFTLRQPE